MQLQQGVLGILGCSLHKINLYKFAVHKYQVHVSGSVIFPTIERLFVFSEFCWQKRRTVKCLVLFYCTAINYGIFSCVFDNYKFLKQMWNDKTKFLSHKHITNVLVLNTFSRFNINIDSLFIIIVLSWGVISL